MKNPYTKEKIQSIYAGIPDAKLEKNKKTYTIWGIVCIVLIYFIPIGAFLLWRSWLISQELRNRTIEKRNVADPATVPQRTFEPSHYTFADGSKLYIADIEISNFDVVKTYHTKVVGVTYKNDDGSSRQENIENSYDGEKLIFREYEYEGKPAIAVYTQFNEQIGFIKKELASDISAFIDADERQLIMHGEITEITGGEYGEKYGCNICVYLLARK